MPLPLVSTVFAGLAGAEHAYIMFLEMFMWNTPRVNKIFGIKDPVFAGSPNAKRMAANLGLYNGFLAAGLAWAIIHPDSNVGRQVGIFFSSLILTAATYGAVTVTPRILLMQGTPAALALGALLLGY
ncbi:integral membrane protein [Zopfochytrium polystomum]|nr:integral membrane protein [Zopfochytrium polystomum]